jgi:integrase
MEREKPILSVEEILRILCALKEENRLFFIVIFVTRMRVGEACALRWQDLNFQTKTMTISYTLYRGILQDPKTEASVRSYELPDGVMYDLLYHRQSSSFKHDNDFIFCIAEGRPLNDNFLRKHVLHPAMLKVEIQPGSYSQGFHIFRHSAGSILYDRTGRTKMVQKLLGHSREQITADTYIQLPKTVVAEATSILAREIYSGMNPGDDEETGLIHKALD